MPQRIGDERYVVSFAELGKPMRKGDVKVHGLGTVVLDDADIHYALAAHHADFVVRRSRSLGTDTYVVVSRAQSA